METRSKVYEVVCWLKANEIMEEIVEEFRYDNDLKNFVADCNEILTKLPTIAEKIAFVGMVIIGSYQDDLRWGYSYYIPATRDVVDLDSIRYARKVLRRKGVNKLKVKDLIVYPA